MKKIENKKKKGLFPGPFIFSLFFLCGSFLIPFFSCEQKNLYNQGKIMYENFCANCHMEDGTGLEGIIPPLAGADFLKKYPEKLPCIIRAGMSGEIEVNGRVYNTEMPGVPRLKEFEITNIINYINTAWGNDLPIQKHLDVREALKDCSY